MTLRELRGRIEERTGARLSISYLSELERVETAPPIETLARVSQGYGISLQDLLDPVDFLEAFDSDPLARYPSGLRAFAQKEALDPEWLRTLARVEFRGRRPEREDEWRAIYAMLKALIEPKIKE
jgi:transcriptional regulator with XRE-family HTH domain